jgi:hypothetical protein
MKIAGKTAVMIIIGVAGQRHDDGRRGGGHSVISAEASVEKLFDLVKLDAILAETVAQCSDGAAPDCPVLDILDAGRSGNPGARSRQRRPKKRANDERYPDGHGYQPVHEMRQVLPKRKLLSIVDVKSNQHQNVRQPHPGDMKPDPIAPAMPER